VSNGASGREAYFGFLGALVGAGIGAIALVITVQWQLGEQQDTAVRERSFKYIEMYWSPLIYESRVVLSNWENAENVQTAERKIKIGDAAIKRHIIDEVVKKNGWQKNVKDLLDFYSVIVSCVKTELCDPAPVCATLAEDMEIFEEWYFYYLQYMDKDVYHGEYAPILLPFVDRFCTKKKPRLSGPKPPYRRQTRQDTN
jgi:hypothetical protein